jgi:DNA methylase
MQEFYWNNPAKLPSPIEWVCKRRIRVKDTVSPLFWLAKVEDPKADWTNVRPPHRPRRTSWPGPLPLVLGPGEDDPLGILPWEQDALPADLRCVGGVTNVLTIANTDSNSRYLRYCRELGITAHPARFPLRLPQFFIEGLTEPGDVVLDFMAGANMVGAAAETLGRRWVAFEQKLDYLAASAFHFLAAGGDLVMAQGVYRRLSMPQASPVHLESAVALNDGAAQPILPGKRRARGRQEA